MSFAMTDEQLEQLFDQIPVLSGRPRSLEELSGGLTNRNVKVTTPDGEFVARCTDTNADMLGIDRDVEHANSRAAEEAGVGAPVLDYRPDLGVLVIGYLPGRTLSRENFGEPGMVERVAQGCRQLHEGPRFTGVFDMFERQQGYLRTVQEGDYRIPEGYLDHAESIERIRKALTVRDEGTVPCNNDLLAENFIDDGEKIWLIDYEYSGNNDACFELGNIWNECRLSLDQLEELVTSYYGRPRRSRLARARLQGIVGQYGWTLWGAIQHAVSPMDFDFWEWAMERYDIATRELAGPDLDQLLDDVQLSD
jgi:thiamine kinase-like enzyme